MKILSHANAKKKTKKAEGFQISHFYWSFSSDIMAAKELTSRLEIANWVTGPLTVQQRTTVYIVLPAISDTSEEDEKDVGIIYSYALFFFFSFFNSVVQTVQQGRSAVSYTHLTLPTNHRV